MTATTTSVPNATEIRAVVTRADGTVQDYGVIAARYRNPLKQLVWNLYGKHAAAHLTARLNLKGSI